MPPSRYVSSRRLLRLTTFLAVAFVVLLALAVGLRAMDSSASMRRVLVLAWFVVLPLGGWWVWKTGGDGRSDH
jgi:ABC-type nickel/cobalt efflux system permease component RcnA